MICFHNNKCEHGVERESGVKEGIYDPHDPPHPGPHDPELRIILSESSHLRELRETEARGR